jgi:hypothetical protein
MEKSSFPPEGKSPDEDLPKESDDKRLGFQFTATPFTN